MTTQALLKFEGADGSTTFTDETGNQTWSIQQGTPEIDTDQFRAGASSLLINGNDEGIEATLATGLSGAFTVECWYRQDGAAVTGNHVIFEISSGTTQFYVYRNTTDDIYCATAAQTLSNFNIVANDQWHHVAITRNTDNEISFWVDGLLRGTFSATNSETFNLITIGQGIQQTSARGWIDGFRVIDEQIFFTSFYGNADPDPQIAYTPQSQPEIILINDDELLLTNQVMVPVNQGGAEPFVIIDDCPDAAAPAVSGLQYWG